MFIVHVHVQVKPEQIDAFRKATLTNAAASVKEPGIARFDILQDKDDPAHFLLVEVYRTSEAPAKHKQTAHYQVWKAAVAEMMAAPRTKQLFDNIFPDNQGWG